MYAVIKTGGKQYRVAADDLIKVEKLQAEPGDIIELPHVLLVQGDGGLEVGSPFLTGVTVAAEVVGHVRGERIIVFKKRRRHHYRRRNGHRQDLTALRITEILTGGRKPEKKKAEARPKPPAIEAAPAQAAEAPEKKPARRPAAKAKAPAKAKPKAK